MESDGGGVFSTVAVGPVNNRSLCILDLCLHSDGGVSACIQPNAGQSMESCITTASFVKLFYSAENNSRMNQI